jgi:hypothetical protein
MKKLIWVLFLISMISAMYANSQGAIATTDFMTGLTMLMPDGTTPVPDGTLCQIMLPGVDGLIDAPNPDGTPGGDDFLVTGVPGNNYFEFPWDSSWTGVTGQLYTPTAFTWPTAGLGTEPCANEGENFYLRLFDAPAVSGAAKYLNSALYLLPIGYLDLVFNTPAHWDYTTGFNWQGLAAGQPIPPAGGTVTFPSGGTVTFPPGNSGTIDMTFDSSNPPPGIPVGNPQTLWWDYDTSGAVITVWPVTLRLEFPLAAGVTAASSAILHETAAVWYALINGNPIAAHAANLPNQALISASLTYDFSTDPSFIEFDTWTLSDWGMDGDSPLPVTLTNFAAEFVSNNLTILWTTQSESNNLGWNIYRGESNTALEEDNTILINGIELIEGAGTTAEPTNYTYQDLHPVVENNTYWYWLESVSYSNDTGIYGPISLFIPEGAIIPELPTTTILYGNYPNPFNPITTIQFDVKEGETAELTIYNIKGQIVESKTFEAGAHNEPWDSKDNASGVYFYKLSSDSYSEFKKMMLLK